MKAARGTERSPRERAYEILRRVEEGGAWASTLLDRHEAEIRDPRDASLLHETVLGVLRWRSVLDYALGRVASRPPDRMDSGIRRVLRLGAYGLLFLDRVPDFAAVDSAVELVKRTGNASGAGFVNGVLRALARLGSQALPAPAARGDVAALAVTRSHPEWWVERRVRLGGWDEAEALLEADNRPAPTVLRPNLRRTTPRDLERRLAAEGVRTEPCRFVEEASRVVAGAPQRTAAFREGYAWIQDEAAQLVPRLLGRVLRPRVADLCAAPGVKTLQLHEALPVGGTLVAADRHAGRLRRLRANARRVGATGIVVVAADLATPSPALRGPFDHVVVDAPCSGTGTLRRHPEIRWRLRPQDLPRLAARQQRLLETAATLVASGGELLYAVCSLEPEEGEDVLARFVERHPEFAVIGPGTGFPEAARSLIGADGILRTSPSAGLDGFFAARLRRIR